MLGQAFVTGLLAGDTGSGRGKCTIATVNSGVASYLPPSVGQAADHELGRSDAHSLVEKAFVYTW